MSDLPILPTRRSGSPRATEEFFGAEDAHARESIDSSVWEAVDRFLEDRPSGPEQLIPLLLQVQHRLGYVPFPVQEYVAEQLGLAPVQVFGVVSFYRAFTTDPPARHRIRVCLCPSCSLGGAARILESALDACGLREGGRSEDGLFDVRAVRSLGVCGLDPVITVNDASRRGVTPDGVRALVDRLRRAAVAEGNGRE